MEFTSTNEGTSFISTVKVDDICSILADEKKIDEMIEPFIHHKIKMIHYTIENHTGAPLFLIGETNFSDKDKGSELTVCFMVDSKFPSTPCMIELIYNRFRKAIFESGCIIDTKNNLIEHLCADELDANGHPVVSKLFEPISKKWRGE